MLPFTENPRTDSEDAFLILIPHDGKSFGCDYESGMDEPIDVSGFLIN